MVELSVLIPNYNSKKGIREVLDSLIKSISNCELIISDDASADNSIKIIKDFLKSKKIILKKKNMKVKIYYSKKNNGASINRNKCIKKSHGKKLFFLDCDVIINKKTFLKLKKLSDYYDIVFPKVLNEDKKIIYPLYKNEIRTPLASTCFVIRKDVLKKLDKLFDKNLKYGSEDTEFFLRCAFFGLKSHYEPSVYVIHKNRDRSSSEYLLYNEVKAIIYVSTKLKPILKKINLKIDSLPLKLIKLFIVALFNFNCWDRENNALNVPFYKILPKVFFNHTVISKKGNLFTLKIYLKALKDSFYYYKLALKEREKIMKFIEE